MDNTPQNITDILKEVESRRKMWRLIGKILIDTSHLDLYRFNGLPDLIWSTFTNFDHSYKEQLEKEGLREILPSYLLARPLIGFNEGHDENSPHMSSYVNQDALPSIRHQVFLFLQYVALSERLNSVSGGKAGAVSQQLLQNADSDNFCYVFRRTEGSRVKIGEPDNIKEIPLDRQERFTEALENCAISWPLLDISDLKDDLREIGKKYENPYKLACAGLDKGIFDHLEGEDQSKALVEWWLYEAQADFVLFRGFDESGRIDPKYKWGGVWFLFNAPVIGEHLRALHILVRECFNIAAIEMRARKLSGETERANIGAGMFHNLAHYIFPLLEYAQAIREFANEPDLVAVCATAVRIEDTVGRLDRFQAAVQRHVKHRQAFDEGFIRSYINPLSDVPKQSILIQTRYIEPQLRWFREKQNAPQDRKSLLLFRDLCPGAENLNPLDGDDRETLYDLVRQLPFYGLPDDPDLPILQEWWHNIFGIDIGIEGDFDTIYGEVPLITGVLEELFFNSLAGFARLAAASRNSGKQLTVTSPHIVFEAGLDRIGNRAVFLKNWSLTPLKKEHLVNEPEGDRGWGLYGSRLLLERAGGSLDVWNSADEAAKSPCDITSEGEAANGLKSPLWVGFELVPVGRQMYESETTDSDR